MQLRLSWIALATVLTVACSPAPRDANTVVAEIDGEKITLADLDVWIKEEWFKGQTEGKSPAALHAFRSERLQNMIDARLAEAEAARRGVEVEAMLEEETRGVEVSDGEIASFYQQNRERLGGASLEEIGPRIRRHLAQQKQRGAAQRFVRGLREEARVVVRFEAPRVAIGADGPALGPESAAVTIVEFSDFQCPFCARAGSIVKEVHERYPDQVRIVYRQFPLDSIHPEARAAAEASLCAAEQELFWPYHDVLFANATALAAPDLARYAEQVGADLPAFNACVAERRYQAQVQRDVDEGQEAGVDGTPAFFVNGILLSGAQPVDEFVRLIEDELRRAGS